LTARALSRGAEKRGPPHLVLLQAPPLRSRQHAAQPHRHPPGPPALARLALDPSVAALSVAPVGPAAARPMLLAAGARRQRRRRGRGRGGRAHAQLQCGLARARLRRQAGRRERARAAPPTGRACAVVQAWLASAVRGRAERAAPRRRLGAALDAARRGAGEELRRRGGAAVRGRRAVRARALARVAAAAAGGGRGGRGGGRCGRRGARARAWGALLCHCLPLLPTDAHALARTCRLLRKAQQLAVSWRTVGGCGTSRLPAQHVRSTA